MSPPDFASRRRAMVETQLRARGISDERVLAAMAEVPREEFVADERREDAYADAALGIDCGQTISQPWIVAAICEALELDGSERVLEVGCGSGYSAAVISRLASEVVAIERLEPLAAAARHRLARYAPGVEVVLGDGSLGLPARAPFERIAVHAAMPREPAALLAQLAEGGLLVGPLAAGGRESLVAWRRRGRSREGGDEGEQFERRALAGCRFVPLIGAEGYPP